MGDWFLIDKLFEKLNLKLLGNDFPSLVNSTKNTQILEKGHAFEGHASNAISVNTIIPGIRTS
tara:strand:+ start:1858 stop:2046 length:189 start_codon:yes stop_codon:yes gene_type:complete